MAQLPPQPLSDDDGSDRSPLDAQHVSAVAGNALAATPLQAHSPDYCGLDWSVSGEVPALPEDGWTSDDLSDAEAAIVALGADSDADDDDGLLDEDDGAPPALG